MYLIIILAALIAGLSMAAFILKLNKIDGLHIFLITFLSFCMILFCAFSVTLFATSFKEIGGNTCGGAIGLIFSIYIFVRLLPEKKDIFFTAYILVMPLMYGIGKLACEYAGCCGGIPHIQLIESIVFLTLFVISFILYRIQKYNPIVAAIIYALAKFILDFFRKTHEDHLITLNQVLCILIVVVFLLLNNIKLKRNK